MAKLTSEPPGDQSPSDDRIRRKVETFLGSLDAAGTPRFGISFNSESSETSESSESSETSEMREMPRIIEMLTAVDPDQSSWDEILRRSEPALRLVGVALI